MLDDGSFSNSESGEETHAHLSFTDEEVEAVDHANLTVIKSGRTV